MAPVVPKLPSFRWESKALVDWTEAVVRQAKEAARLALQQALHEAAEEVVFRQVGRRKGEPRFRMVVSTAPHPCPRCGSRLTSSFQRKGTYSRRLLTLAGEVELRLPRVLCDCKSNVPLDFPFLQRKSRVWMDIRSRVLELFAMRVGYRDIAGHLERETGFPLGRCALRQILGELSAVPGPVVWWHPDEPVPEEIQLDGVWIKVKGKLQILLLALDTTYGRRSRLLGWNLGASESEEEYYALTSQLREAGITTEAGLRAAVSDGAAGIHAALLNTWPSVHHQHCHWHILQRVRTKIAHPDHEQAMLKDIRNVLQAKNGADGMAQAKQCIASWAEKEPEATVAFRRLIRHAFTFLKLPRTVVSRASGKVERMAREFRRKYRQMECFRSPRYVAPTVLAWAVRQTAAGNPHWPRKLLSKALTARTLLKGINPTRVVPLRRWPKKPKRPGGSVPGEKHGRRFGPKPTYKPPFPRWV